MRKINIGHIGLITLFGLISVQTLHAQTASPSGTILDSVKQKVEAELADIKKGVAKKAFIGTVTTKDSNMLTITTLTNQTRSAAVSTDTVIKLTGNKDGTIADIKVNDFGIFMGDVDSQNAMTVKRVLILPTPPTDKRAVVFGTVTKSQPNTLTIETQKKEIWTVKVSSSTKYTKNTKYADVEVGDKILVTGVAATTTLTASNLHIIN